MTVTSGSATQITGTQIGEPIAHATKQSKLAAELDAVAKKKISLALFSHAQIMIAAALVQFGVVFGRIGGQLSDNLGSDQHKIDMFLNHASIGMGLATLATIAIFGLSIWLAITSNHVTYSRILKEHHEVFWPKGTAGAWAWIGLAAILVVYIGAVVGLMWLEREGLITRGMNDAGATGMQLLFSVLCIVFAVIRIRQGVKFVQGDEMQ